MRALLFCRSGICFGIQTSAFRASFLMRPFTETASLGSSVTSKDNDCVLYSHEKLNKDLSLCLRPVDRGGDPVSIFKHP